MKSQKVKTEKLGDVLLGMIRSAMSGRGWEKKVDGQARRQEEQGMGVCSEEQRNVG